MKRVAVFLIVLALLSSCQVLEIVGLSTNPLVGVWKANVLIATVTWDIKSSGVIAITTQGSGGSETRSGTWSESGGKLRTVIGGTTSTLVYSMGSGNRTMTVTPESGGLSITFIKQ